MKFPSDPCREGPYKTKSRQQIVLILKISRIQNPWDLFIIALRLLSMAIPAIFSYLRHYFCLLRHKTKPSPSEAYLHML